MIEKIKKLFQKKEEPTNENIKAMEKLFCENQKLLSKLLEDTKEVDLK